MKMLLMLFIFLVSCADRSVIDWNQPDICKAEYQFCKEEPDNFICKHQKKECEK